MTLGCRANQYESQRTLEMLEGAGWTAAGEGEPADLCLVNTCTVTHDADAKAAPFALTEPGVSTLDTFLPHLLALVDLGAFDLVQAFRAASLVPHQILGLSGGSLAPGMEADLCVFDPESSWVAEADTLNSKGHNTPDLGRTLKGRNVMTFLGGQRVWQARRSSP